MNLYEEVQKYVKEKYGVTIKTCWIADVKNGRNEDIKNPCPEEYRAMIQEALDNFASQCDEESEEN